MTRSELKTHHHLWPPSLSTTEARYGREDLILSADGGVDEERKALDQRLPFLFPVCTIDCRIIVVCFAGMDSCSSLCSLQPSSYI
jgi:hypothetical protein